MSYGWLSKRDDIIRDESWFGVDLDPTLPTRWEEYDLVKNALINKIAKEACDGLLLDIGCGFGVGTHMLPDIIARDGWIIEALDLRPPQDGFTENARINRVIGNMTKLSYDDEAFDAITCISVLEHVSNDLKIKTFLQVWRVLKTGGIFIMTMDDQDPSILVDMFDVLFDFGERVEIEGVSLAPHVGFLTGIKR